MFTRPGAPSDWVASVSSWSRRRLRCVPLPGEQAVYVEFAAGRDAFDDPGDEVPCPASESSWLSTGDSSGVSSSFVSGGDARERAGLRPATAMPVSMTTIDGSVRRRCGGCGGGGAGRRRGGLALLSRTPVARNSAASAP
jgi:hypothetical protein